MQTLINTLNGLTLNHYYTHQFITLNSNKDNSSTQVALLEIKESTINNIQHNDRIYDAWDDERIHIHNTLQALIPNAEVTSIDSTTIYKSPNSGHTLTICEGDCTMHIMLTRCMD